MEEAMLYDKLDNNEVQCNVCERRCKISEDQKGFCNVRKNRNGKLFSLVYGKSISTSVENIEKKPFFHFAPGSRALSMATVGCNFKCKFCQNWQISQEYGDIKGKEYTPSELVQMAKNYRADGIAYTYTEPTVFLEYSYDTMKESETALYNVFVSNGYMTEEVIDKISPHLDAINIDIKGDRKFYREMCGVPEMETVKNTAKRFKERGVWVEITNLIIPGYNDEEYKIEKMVDWVRDNLGKETPLHFSRFHPQYKVKDIEPTPIETIERAIKIAKGEGMYYVYGGNIPGHKSESTFCPNCGRILIKRNGFKIKEFNIEKDMRCPYCNEEIDIKGQRWIPNELFNK